jgi:putative transcriptional regulator
MASHPNRGKTRTAYSNPLPDQVIAARGLLTQSEAAALVYSTASKWQKWEVGEDRMHPGLWELFLIKLEKKTTLEILNRLLEQANEVEASTGFAPLANEALTWAIDEITPRQKTSSD